MCECLFIFFKVCIVCIYLVNKNYLWVEKRICIILIFLEKMIVFLEKLFFLNKYKFKEKDKDIKYVCVIWY